MSAIANVRRGPFKTNTRSDSQRSMGDLESAGPLHGLPPNALRPSEQVLRHWAAPGGRGLLTNERCLLLGHPRLLHRAVEWERDLEKIEHLEVVALADDPEVVAFASQSLAGSVRRGDPTAGVVNCEYKVLVDNVPVHVGDAGKCEGIQTWIDEARSARCVALFGHLIPYRS